MADIRQLKWSEVILAITVGTVCLGGGATLGVAQMRIGDNSERIEQMEKQNQEIPMIQRDIKELREAVQELKGTMKSQNEEQGKKLDKIWEEVRTK